MAENNPFPKDSFAKAALDLEKTTGKTSDTQARVGSPSSMDNMPSASYKIGSPTSMPDKPFNTSFDK